MSKTMPWVCLMGPTASGKTALACELLEHFPFEIISIDSVMIYKDLDIGSAKPNKALLARAPHHLIDIISPLESYSVAKCCSDVIACGQAIEARGHIPLLVGGSMMYFRALQQGLSSIPQSDPSVRTDLMNQASTLGLAYLHDQLRACDPESAARIHQHDTQRIVRALEVFISTQKPLSHWLQTTSPIQLIQYCNLILMPDDRAWLHSRIADRFHEMIKDGFIDEVKALEAHWSVTGAHPSMRCVGYRQVWDYLHDHHDLTLLKDKGIAATRQLAKRQMTWLRHWPDAHYFSADNLNLSDIITLMRQIALMQP